MAESKFLIKFSNVNRDKYVYCSPVTSKQGYVECKCEYMRENNKPAAFFFESPRLIAATGIYSLDNKFYIDLLVPMASPFLDWLLAEDEKNINSTADNSDAWFGEHSSTEEISQGYKTSLIFRSKGDEPVIRVNIPSIRGKPALEVFDNNKKVIDISSIVPGVEVACIMEKMPLRFYRDKFTGEYLIYKLKVCSNSQVVTLPPGYIFSEQTTDEEDSQDSGEEETPLYSGSESEDEIQLASSDEEGGDPFAVSGDEEESQHKSGSESEEEEDPLAVSGDEEESQHTSGSESEEEDPLAVSGDESEEEDPLAVSGDESEEDPLAVSGDESSQHTSGSENEEEEDPLAVSGDESSQHTSGSESEEEEDPLAVSGDEDDQLTSGDENEDNPFLFGNKNTKNTGLELDDSSEFELDSEFDISEGGEQEEVKKKGGSLVTSNELTESDFELDDLNV